MVISGVRLGAAASAANCRAWAADDLCLYGARLL